MEKDQLISLSSKLILLPTLIGMPVIIQADNGRVTIEAKGDYYDLENQLRKSDAYGELHGYILQLAEEANALTAKYIETYGAFPDEICFKAKE